MSSGTNHGLKDLFGSVPDAGVEADSPATQTPATQAPATQAPGGPGASHGTPPAQGAHGLAGLGAPAPEPAAPPADATPSIQGVPTIDIPAEPQTPPTSHAPAAQTPTAEVPAAQTLTLSAPLACVILARGEATPLPRMVAALRSQDAAHQIDVILVGDAPDAAREPGGLASLTVLPAAPEETDGQALTRGAQAAGGDLVAILDDHAFPAGDWAGQILSHRHQGFGALTSALGNANPRSKHSWSHMLLEHGAANAGATEEGRPAHARPARNLVFRRETLEALPDLAALLDDEAALARALAERGLPLEHDAEARLAVLNPSRLRETLRARYAAGRLDAAQWRQGLSATKRTGKALKAALGGYARYKRDRGRLFSGDAAVTPKQHGGALALAMMSEGVGRAMGFLRGPGGAAKVRDEQARARLATLNRTDRRQFERPAGDLPR